MPRPEDDEAWDSVEEVDSIQDQASPEDSSYTLRRFPEADSAPAVDVGI